MQGRAAVAHKAHNLDVVGSNPIPATKTNNRKEVMPEKRPLETASEVMQTRTAESALSAAVLQPPTSAEQRIIALLTEMGWVDYLVRVNQIGDIAYKRWINEVCTTPKLQDRCPY
jgi:hypothetical protein